jgi:hypothetical protein
MTITNRHDNNRYFDIFDLDDAPAASERSSSGWTQNPVEAC